MIFFYEAVTKEGRTVTGSVEAQSRDTAIFGIQNKGLVITGLRSEKSASFLHKDFLTLKHVSNKDIVMLSRQLATLFEAQVSALRIFRLLASEMQNKTLANALGNIAESIQGGSMIADAMARHPRIFSKFYVAMIKAGEESGKLDSTFGFLAEYLDRVYELTSKARNALVYPAFVVVVFITVMVLMLTLVIPKIAQILESAGQELPIYTKIVISISEAFTSYGLVMAILVALIVIAYVRFAHTPKGRHIVDDFKLRIPFMGNLYRKLYLSRLADNMDTMLESGIPIIKSLELTRDIVDNQIFKEAINDSIKAVKSGEPLSSAFEKRDVFPNVLTQMIRVGEETGSLGKILKTLANFYRKEVIAAVDTLVGLIEPAMIIMLALGVGVLLASVLMPIYNVSLTFGS